MDDFGPPSEVNCVNVPANVAPTEECLPVKIEEWQDTTANGLLTPASVLLPKKGALDNDYSGGNPYADDDDKDFVPPLQDPDPDNDGKVPPPDKYDPDYVHSGGNPHSCSDNEDDCLDLHPDNSVLKNSINWGIDEDEGTVGEFNDRANDWTPPPDQRADDNIFGIVNLRGNANNH